MADQGTEQWHLDRLGKVTASKIADVMMKPTTAGFQNYKAQLVCERLSGRPTESFTSAAMQHGTDTEAQARAFYEIETELEVIEVGFIDHPSIAMTGASPDGLVGDDALVEIKCPQPPEHIRMLLGGDIKRNYVLQMQWQMRCTERKSCDFVSFNPSFPPEMQLHVQTVHFDAALVADMEASVASFLKEVDADFDALSARFPRKDAA